MRRPPPKGSTGWFVGASMLGAAVGLALFAAETWLIARQNLTGVHLDADGAFASLARAVEPLLPGLLGRVAVAYAGGGLFLGALAALFTLCWRPAPGRRRWTLWLVELSGALLLLFLHRAMSRPALVDDVLPELLLGLLLDVAEPVLPEAAAAMALCVHALVAIREHGARPLKMAGAAAAALLLAANVQSPPPQKPHGSPPPLVVLLGVDAFRPDRLSRAELAPNIQRFVRDSTLFERAYTPIAQTEPAWRSLLTARWPHRTGSRYPLTAEARWAPLPTFTKTFAEHGYATVFATDCSRFNYQTERSGFEERRQPPRGAMNFLLEKLRYRALGAFADNGFGAAWLPEFVENRALAGVHDPLGHADRLATRWAEVAQHGPALLAFHATAAHFPGDPVFPFFRKYVGAYEPPSRRTRMHFATVAPGATGGWSREGSEALYDELLSQADAQVGVLIDRLKAEGRYDEALVIVFSDHGESFHADKGALAGATPVHGARVSEEENRILLAIKWPRSLKVAPGRVDALVRLIDLGPTLLDVAKLPALPGAEGVSLLPYARAEREGRLYLYAETGFTHVSPDVFVSGHRARAPRSLSAYDVRADGVIEVKPGAHEEIVADKDIAAYDGVGWWIRSPLADGSVAERCVGSCSQSLREWLVATAEPPGPSFGTR